MKVIVIITVIPPAHRLVVVALVVVIVLVVVVTRDVEIHVEDIVILYVLTDVVGIVIMDVEETAV